jgi:protease-4
MGATAASGGYWIAAYADRIYALPSTLTGSFGVVGGKFALEELFGKLGVNWESVTWGKIAGMWSVNAPFSQSGAERMNAMLDDIYKSFIARVAKGRKMSEADVDKIAGGRVWTGRRAVDVGLVDELGGLENALDYAAGLAGAKSRDDLNVVVYPKPKTALEQVIEFLETQASMGQTAALQKRALEVAQPALDMLQIRQNPQGFMTYEPLRLQ